MLNQKDVEALYSGTFRLDCPILELHLDDAGTSHVIAGPGAIVQGTDGKLFFEMFYKWQDENSYKLIDRLNQNIHTLVATDMFGRKWQSTNVFRDVPQRSNHGSAVSFSVIRGALYYLTYKYESPKVPSDSAGQSLRLFFKTNILLPFNKNTSYERSYLDQQQPNYTRDVLAMEIAGYGLTMYYQAEKSRLSVEIIPTTSEALADHLQSTFGQCLQFTCGTIVQWLLKIERRAERFMATISGNDWANSAVKMVPPVDLTVGKDIDFVTLFNAYWHTVASNGEGEPHQITSWTSSILYAESGSVEIQITTLCLALESMMKLIDISHIHVWPTEIEESLKKVIKTAKEQITTLSSELSSDHKKDMDLLHSRVIGSLKNIGVPGTSVTLDYLVRNRVITDKQAECWKKHRNPVAHGKLPSEPFEELFRDKVILLAAFYRIVLFIIGYSGNYINWQVESAPSVPFEHLLGSDSKRKNSGELNSGKET